MSIVNKGTVGAASGGIAAAIALIAGFVMQHEGHTNRIYRDIGGVLTVCYGHTGKDIVVTHTYSDGECSQLLDADLRAAAVGVVKVSPILIDKPYLLASAISFSYNVGVGAYRNSSVARDFNAGRFAAGCKDMLKYTYAGGKYSKGLDNRRHAEYYVCMKGI